MRNQEFVFDNGADDEHLDGFLDYIKGSLSEERRNSLPKNPNAYRNSKRFKEYRKFLKNQKNEGILLLSDVLAQPSLLTERIALETALFPNVALTDFRVKGIHKIQGKGQYRQILNILLAIYSIDDEWLKFVIGEPFLKLVPKIPKSGIQSELAFVAKVLALEPSQRTEVLSKIYSKHNLSEKIATGFFYIRKYSLNIQTMETSTVRMSQRKRGYNDKGSSNPIHVKRRMQCMTEIEKDLELIRARILKKQMELFERNLDKLLEIQTCNNRKDIKEIIRNQNREIKEIHDSNGLKQSTLGGKYYEIYEESDDSETREY